MATNINLLADLLHEVQCSSRVCPDHVLNFVSKSKTILDEVKRIAATRRGASSIYQKVLSNLNISSVVDLRKFMASHADEIKADEHVGSKLNMIVPVYKSRKEPKHSYIHYKLTSDDLSFIEEHSGNNANGTDEYIQLVDFTLYEQDIEDNNGDPEHCWVIRNGNQDLPPIFMHLPEELHAKVAHYIVKNGQQKGGERFMYEKWMKENLGEDINVTDARMIQYNNWVELGRPDRIDDNRKFNKPDAKNLLKNSGIFNRVIGESFSTADKRMINLLLEKYGYNNITSYIKQI